MLCPQEARKHAEAEQAAQIAFKKSPLASLQNLYGVKVRQHGTVLHYSHLPITKSMAIVMLSTLWCYQFVCHKVLGTTHAAVVQHLNSVYACHPPSAGLHKEAKQPF